MSQKMTIAILHPWLRAALPIALLLPATISKAADLTAYDCVITPSQTADVSSPVSGTLSEVLVDRSDRVTRGQVLARLNSGVETAAAALARAKADLDSEEEIAAVNLKFDGERLDRLLALYGVSMTSSQDKEDAERNMSLSRARLQYARTMHEVRRLELRTAEAHVEQKIVRSPIDGVVLKRYKNVSEYVEAQPIVRVVQLDPLYVEAIVPMDQFGKIKSGMHARVFSDAFHGGPQRATVRTVDQMGDAASGTFGVRLELPNPGSSLPAGVKCNVQIQAEPPRVEGSEQRPQTDDADALAHHVTLTDDIDAIPTPLSAVSMPLPSSCTTFGPYPTRVSMQPLLDFLHDKDVTYSLRQNAPSDLYLLLAPKQETRLERNALMERMRRAGITDMAIVEKGKYRGRVALGVFGAEENSIRRTTELARLGFSTEIHKIRDKAAPWWIDVAQPDQKIDSLIRGDDAVTEHVRKLFGDGDSASSRCPDRISS